MQSRPTADASILLVDDERQTLKYFERAFAKDFKVLTAASADEAETIVDANPGKIGVLISDQRMPGRNGVSLLNAVRRKHPAIVRMLTTAYSELDDAIEAVNRGEIFRYIVKPWDFDLLRQEINTGLLVYGLQSERDLLVGEKLNVRQRMIAVDRARDLAVVAASLPKLRFAKLAVNDYVRDCAANFAAAPSLGNAAALDLWSLPQAEAKHMGGVAAETARIADLLQSAAAGKSVSVAECLRDAVAATASQAAAAKVSVGEGTSAPAAVAVSPLVVGEVMTAALSAVISAVPEGGSVQVSSNPAPAVNGTPGASVVISTKQASSGADTLLYTCSSRSGKIEPGRLFAAYVAARESGGSLTTQHTGEALKIELLLPSDPSTAKTAEIKSDWLEKLFQHFENWPA